MSFYLDSLNEQQRAAVEYLDGPQLVIAGAGSGKTRVLTYKIVHLLANGYEPWRIMALTFTNKAAREMRERITALSGQQTASRLWMGTFHSIFARILRVNADRIGYKSSFTIYDASDSRNLVKTIIRDMGLDDKVYKPSAVASEISTAKNALISPRQYAADRDIQRQNAACKRYALPEIYTAYMSRCRVAQAMDFDDLLYYTNILLRDNDDLRRHYQEYFRYILVDEYQDTNFAQHTIVSQLCGESRMLCVVGDDAQSIYSFRGANIRNILHLRRTFPGIQLFKLEQNYRSTENIINAADTLIAKNTEQIEKHVFSRNGAGQKIEVIQSYSDYEESYLVANRIAQVKRQTGDSYEDFAILYRTNAQSRVLEESLRKRNIPYRIYGGLSFYQRKEVKDALAYFRLALNPDDDEAIRRVINIPARGIGDTTLGKLVATAIQNSVSLWSVVDNPAIFDVKINAGTARKIEAFAGIIRVLNKLVREGAPVDQIARAVFIQSRLMDQYTGEATPENISKRQNLDEFMGSVNNFVKDKIEEGQPEQITLADYMTQVSLSTDADNADETPGDKVTLMTIHAAKGLEFGNVFVVGVEEDLLPSSMGGGTLQEIEEERRLLYVAITRAKRFCMLSYAGSRYRNGQTVTTRPSRFLRDIDRRYLRLLTGTEIDSAPSHSSPYSSFGSYKTTASSSFTSGPRTQAAPRRAPNSFDDPRKYVSPTLAGSAGTKPAASAAGTLHTPDELRVGQTILHDRFGKGTIIEVDAENPTGARIKVNFSNIDIKTLLLKFARFTLAD